MSKKLIVLCIVAAAVMAAGVVVLYSSAYQRPMVAAHRTSQDGSNKIADRVGGPFEPADRAELEKAVAGARNNTWNQVQPPVCSVTKLPTGEDHLECSASADAVMAKKERDDATATRARIRIDFAVDKTMLAGKPHEAKLEATLTGSSLLIVSDNNALTRKFELASETDTKQVKASIETTRAKIETKSAEWQSVKEGSRAFWIWEITPQTAGTLTLYVSVQQRGKDRDAPPDDLQRFTQDVTVTKTLWAAIRESLTELTLVGTMLVAAPPLIAAVYAGSAWWRGRRKKPDDDVPAW
jgi:hypothetical protein